MNSPAQQAGLQPGDLILSIDGTAVSNAQDAIRRIAAERPGSRLAVHALRGRQEMDRKALVSERPRTGGGGGTRMTIPRARHFASAAELDAALGERLARAIGGAEASRTAVMLSGGRTPLPAYRELAGIPRARRGVCGPRMIGTQPRTPPRAIISSRAPWSMHCAAGNGRAARAHGAAAATGGARLRAAAGDADAGVRDQPWTAGTRRGWPHGIIFRSGTARTGSRARRSRCSGPTGCRASA